MKRLTIKIIFSIVTVIFINPGFVSAAEKDQEIQVTGGVSFVNGDAATGTAQLNLEYGYMWRPKWQVGISGLASYEMNDPIEDVWVASTTAQVKFYPLGGNPDARWQPFVGGFIGMGYTDVDNAWVAGPVAGIKYNINDSIFAVVQYRYEDYFKRLKAGAETTDFNSSNNVLTMGLGFRW